MATFSIESNGRLERTALYYNGEQIAGARELFLNLDEEGTFDAVLQYKGKDDNTYSKQVFVDFLEQLETMPPAFSEEEAQQLQLLTVESNGEIQDTIVTINEQPLDGITSLLIHIKAPVKKNNSSFLGSLFSKETVEERGEFKAEITFRNEDGTLSVEPVF